jgi:UDP:flavonoid glycosyltransferase YjiC (YdhE family)
VQGRVLFVTWDGGGNVNPVLALGPRLTAAGVEVAGYGPPSLAGRFGAAGLAYAGRDAADPWDLTAMARDVRDEVARVGADIAVVDYMLPGALVGAGAAKVPVVALVHTLYGALLADGAPSPMGMAGTVDDVNVARSDVGLAPVARLGDLLDGCVRVLVTSPAALDDPAPNPGGWAPNVRHVGPVLEGPGPDAGWQPPGDPGEPLVLVSLGTTPMDEVPVLQRIVDALAAEPVRVLVTLGAHLDPAALRLPGNATATGYVRHAACLPYAAATVTHAGLGTVLASLAHGVPLVCVPLGREQPDNAAAVVRLGAGLVVPPAAGGEAVRDAVREVLADPAYRSAAAAVAGTLPAPGEPSPAEDEIAALLPA